MSPNEPIPMIKDNSKSQEKLPTQYASPYWEYGKQKSSELGPGSTNYPYTIETTLYGKVVEFNGMVHTNDPYDQSLVRLEDRFRKFIAKSKKPIVFIEGGMREVDGLDRDEVVRQSSEAGLMMKLAIDSNTPVESPEPPEERVVQELLMLFTPEEIMYGFFIRDISQWYRNKANDLQIAPAKDYVEKRLIWHTKTVGLENENVSFQYYANIFNDKYGLQPEDLPHDIERKLLQVAPSPKNPRSAKTSDIRNEYIYKQIQKATREGHDVFVVYGSHHAFVFEQMLAEQNDQE